MRSCRTWACHTLSQSQSLSRQPIPKWERHWVQRLDAVAHSAEGCLVLFTYRTAGAATPRAELGSFGEARYSSSAAFTSSPFKRRSKTFDDPKAAGRPPRLRKVSRNHTPRWFTGKR